MAPGSGKTRVAVRSAEEQRERAMKGFRGVGAAQRFLSAFSGISPRFRPRRHLMPRT
jgi:hypothetical protein